MNRKKALIIHADDYGLARSVSDGIIKAHRHGLVTSTSILANMVSDDELRVLKENLSLDIGVHFTLTMGNSVLPIDEVGNLVDENGAFFKRGSPERPIDKNGVVDFSNLNPGEIAIEFEAQLFRLKIAGLEPSHADTHHHIHVDEVVLSVVMHLAQEYSLAVRSISDDMRKRFIANGIKTNDYFEGRFFRHDSITLENVEKILIELPMGIIELMCHPGFNSEELKTISGYTFEREMELEILTSSQARRIVVASGVMLAGWREAML